VTYRKRIEGTHGGCGKQVDFRAFRLISGRRRNILPVSKNPILILKNI